MIEKKSIESLADWLRNHNDAERETLAEACNTSVSYLYVIAGGHRRAGSELAKDIEKHTSRQVPKADLRPDLWGRAAA